MAVETELAAVSLNGAESTLLSNDKTQPAASESSARGAALLSNPTATSSSLRSAASGSSATTTPPTMHPVPPPTQVSGVAPPPIPFPPRGDLRRAPTAAPIGPPPPRPQLPPMPAAYTMSPPIPRPPIPIPAYAPTGGPPPSFPTPMAPPPVSGTTFPIGGSAPPMPFSSGEALNFGGAVPPGVAYEQYPNSDSSWWGKVELYQHSLLENETVKTVTDKFKNSFSKLVTTLDPQMRDYIGADGNPPPSPGAPSNLGTIAICGADGTDVFAIHEGFQRTLGRVEMLPVSGLHLAPGLSVGFQAALDVCRNLILQCRSVHPQYEVVVALQRLIVETTPGQWNFSACICVQDSNLNLEVQQIAPFWSLPPSVVESAIARYPIVDRQLSISVGELIEQLFPGQANRLTWHEHFTSLPWRTALAQSSRQLSHMYAQKRQTSTSAATNLYTG